MVVEVVVVVVMVATDHHLLLVNQVLHPITEGGGFIGNGGDGCSGVTTGGFSFLNGGVGGVNVNSYANYNGGGFGGGGGSWNGGGGGGGYSGGGGSYQTNRTGGGGGGSYDINGVNNNATKYSTWNNIMGTPPSTYNAGYNTGNGFVIIY